MAPPTDAASSEQSRGSFLAFLASLFLSKLADQILLFLVPLVVFQETQDVSLSGLAFAVEAFPRFVSFPICGALCDRMSPVRLMRWSQVMRAGVCVACATVTQWHADVAFLVAASAICGVLTTQGAMSREVILPQAFTRLRFEKVLAYTQTADQIGAVLGPLLAAVLLTALTWQAVVAATAGLFLASDAALAIWRRQNTRDFHLSGAPARSLMSMMGIALHRIFYTPGLRRLVIQAAGVNLVVGVTLASCAALVTGVHKQSADYFAILQAVGAVVTVCILLAIAHVTVPARRLGAVSYVLMILGGVLTAISPQPLAYALGYLAVIGFDKMFNIYLRTTRQKLIPVADFGKTTGVMTLMNNTSQPLAGVAVGLFAGHSSVSTVILVLTAMMAVLGLASFASAPGHSQSSFKQDQHDGPS